MCMFTINNSAGTRMNFTICIAGFVMELLFFCVSIKKCMICAPKTFKGLSHPPLPSSPPPPLREQTSSHQRNEYL